jgi:hypothetical protein
MEDTYLLTMRCPVYRRRDSHSGFRTELETLIGDVKGKRTSGDPTRPKVPMRRSGSDRPIVVMKWGNAHGAKGAGHSRRDRWVNRKLEEPTVSTEDGSLQWVARAGYVERPKSGSVRGSGCNSPDLLGSVAETSDQIPTSAVERGEPWRWPVCRARVRARLHFERCYLHECGDMFFQPNDL